MGDFQMRKTYFPTGSSGNFHAAGWVRRTYRIKKTSGKRHPLGAWLTSAGGTKVSRCRTLGASWQPGRARTRERAMRLHDGWKFPERFDGNQKRQAVGAR